MTRVLLSLVLVAVCCAMPMAFAQAPNPSQAAPAAPARPPGGALNNVQALALYTRSMQLMESTMVAVPALARPGAPLLENARAAVQTLRLLPGNARATYEFLTSLRAYMALSDVLPRPNPFPEAGERQFAELRGSMARVDSYFLALIQQKDAQIRNGDPDNLGRYAEVDSRMGPPQSGKARVVFLGDSITDGWRLNEYFPDRDFINRGIGGQITSQMLGRMKADVLDLQPAAVLILAGTNDLARGTPVNIIENNIILMCELAEAHKIKVILSTILPVSDYHKDAEHPNYEMTAVRPPEQIRAINSWMKTYCGQHSYMFLDYYSDMVDASGQMKADLANDGLHPNSLGYRVMAPLALAAIDQTVAKPVIVPQQVPRRKRLFGK